MRLGSHQSGRWRV